MVGQNKDIIQAIRLISDTVLYQDAVDFVAENEMPEDSQLNGLLEYSRRWDQLKSFIERQENREWPDKKKHYKDFYSRLSIYLKALRNRTKNEFKLIPADLSRREEQEKMNEIFPLLAQEYTSHLVADALFKNSKSKKDSKRGEKA